jgi:SAM-dependent methyltransferase
MSTILRPVLTPDTHERGDSLLSRPTSYDTTRLAYDQGHSRYNLYADGDILKGLFEFDPKIRQYAYEDHLVWKKLCSLVKHQLRAGSNMLRILDVGCGQGTWLIRVALACAQKGVALQGVGFDVAPNSIDDARYNLAEYRDRYPALDLDLTFQVGDLTKSLPFTNGAFDVVLCLNTVLNHLGVEDIPAAIGELLRVTKGIAFATVKGKGSPSTAYICSMEDVEHWEQVGDELRLKLRNGESHQIQSHLFTCGELRQLFGAVGNVKEILGLDILTTRCLYNRFCSDRLPQDELLAAHVDRIEAGLCHREQFADVANHIGVVTAPKKGTLCRRSASFLR